MVSGGLTADSASAGDYCPPLGRRPRWAAVVSLAIGSFATVTTEFLPIGLLTNIAEGLHVSEGTAGLMVTLPGVVAAVAAPTVVLASGRLDRRAVLVGLSFVLVLSNLVAALASNFGTILIARVFLGVCVGGFWTIAPGATSHLVPPALQAKAMSYVLAGISLATVAAVPASSLLANLVGWRAAFGVAGAVSGAVLILQMLVLPPMPTARATSLRDLASPLMHPGARIGLLVSLFLIGGHFAAYTYLTPMLQHLFGLPSASVSWLLLAYGAAGFIGTFAGGRLVSLGSRLTALVATIMIAGVLFIAGSFGGGVVAGTMVSLVWGAAFGLVPLAMTSWMIEDMPPETQEAAQAVLICCFQIAIACGALFGGMVVDRDGVASVLLVGSVFSALATLAILTLGGPLRARVLSPV